MNSKARATSILHTPNIDSSITGVKSFDLSKLQPIPDLEFVLPSNLRLGHLAERVVSAFIKASPNYNILHENVQLIQDKTTIGEIDFILEENQTKQIIHLEMAYKFYLFDPGLSSVQSNNWIGPNRKDSLIEKLEKLKQKQFPLLYHECTKAQLPDINITDISQELCLLVSLYIPYEYVGTFSNSYKKAISGFYLNFDIFLSLDSPEKTYYLPSKKEWGMSPTPQETWNDFQSLEANIRQRMSEKQAVLCWQNNGDVRTEFFIVWW